MLETDYFASKAFIGVRFVLFGFDPLNEPKVRSKLIDGGGVDAGQYGQSCTHVIVDKIVYDDPVCVAARNDGKTLVTGLWVDRSFDVGMPADATFIMYRPVRDFNGIPGARSLIVCLTGYQGQARQDIMTMVDLMGAQFSKPLIANQATHLICYKFEGEKYELAKRMEMIKLVNHHWLEDCLRDWELLPEHNYSLSAYELEIMVAEAQDSEEDAVGTTLRQSGREKINKLPRNLEIGSPRAHDLPNSTREPPVVLHNACENEGLLTVANYMPEPKAPISNNVVDHAPGFHNIYVSEVPACRDASILRDGGCAEPPDVQEQNPSSGKSSDALESNPMSAKRPYSDSKFSAASYTRKTPRISPSSVSSGKLCNVGGSPTAKRSETFTISPYKAESEREPIVSECAKVPQNSREILYKEASGNKRQKSDVVSSSPKSQKMAHDVLACTDGNASVGSGGQELESISLVDGVSKVSKCFSLGNAPSGNNTESTLQRSFRELDLLDLTRKPESGNLDGKISENVILEADMLLHQQQVDGLSSSCNRKSEVEKSHTLANLDTLKEGDDKLITKPLGKKMNPKKILGSRPKLKVDASLKGPIYLNNTAAQNPATHVIGREKSAEKELSDGHGLETSTPAVSAAEVREKTVTKSGDDIEDRTDFMDDETEAPEDTEHDNIPNQEKDDAVKLLDKSDGVLKKQSEEAHHVAKYHTSTCPGSVEDNNSAQLLNKGELTLQGNDTNNNVGKGKKMSGKTKCQAVPSVVGEKCKGKKGKLIHVGQRSRNASKKMPQCSVEVEKENTPITSVNQAMNQAKKQGGKRAVLNDRPVKPSEKAGKTLNMLDQLKTEAKIFILSGHRLQRKEFQQVIRRLKGKFCRDSHQWSYQATHFIAPDPIRRTEKFFAAAASGRWILKTEYLTACSQAAMFLAEEPYEWHKNGLSEDGAINLEAPRKWRLLREKTGHGAFHGMRIIVYGECIAPNLDTLKRAVKAGDGTILATSPPYTRFLSSGVDYAIVSPGMPRVDLWVQEFLKHEIPCVVADYLVDYVCKPGFSLERHVLYSNHAWAEKSFANLSSRAEEIIADSTPSDAYISDDMECQFCGSRHRREVMLICGNESSSLGCGVGMHMDCCNPPLENIPEEDWFCPKCSRNQISPNKEKGSSSLKCR